MGVFTAFSTQTDRPQAGIGAGPRDGLSPALPIGSLGRCITCLSFVINTEVCVVSLWEVLPDCPGLGHVRFPGAVLHTQTPGTRMHMCVCTYVCVCAGMLRREGGFPSDAALPRPSHGNEVSSSHRHLRGTCHFTPREAAAHGGVCCGGAGGPGSISLAVTSRPRQVSVLPRPRVPTRPDDVPEGSPVWTVRAPEGMRTAGGRGAPSQKKQQTSKRPSDKRT